MINIEHLSSSDLIISVSIEIFTLFFCFGIYILTLEIRTISTSDL